MIQKIEILFLQMVIIFVCSERPLLAKVSDLPEVVAKTDSACVAIQPFYWEIGNADGVLVKGSTGDLSITRHTDLKYASASKFIFGAYLAERRMGKLTFLDLKVLRMQTGFVSLKPYCLSLPRETVSSKSVRFLTESIPYTSKL